MPRYLLTWEADQELEHVFDYTEEHFGLDQALKYIYELEALFELLCDNNTLGRERNEIKPGLRSFNKESHIVFYRIANGQVIIVRVLHVSRDMPNFLK
jgi:toxin ParE1/3/4